MKPLSMNMSKLKKIAGDKKSSTFAHDDGHTMVIVHAALPAAMRKQIEKLAVCEDSKSKKMAQGGDVEKPSAETSVRPDKGFGKVTLIYAEGGEVNAPCTNPNCKSYGKVHPNCRCHGGYAKGGEVQTACSANSHHHPSCALYKEGGTVLDTPDTSNIPEAAKKDAEQRRKQDQEETDRYGKPLVETIPLDESGETTVKSGQKVKLYADPQEPVAANDSAPMVEMSNAPLPEQQPVAVSAPIPAQGQVIAPDQPGQPTPVNPAAALAAQSPTQGVAVPTVPEGRPNLNPDGTMNPSAVAENAQAAADAERNAAIAAGKAHANMQAGYLQQTAENNQRLQQNYQGLSRHVNEFGAWMQNNQINANHYLESMSAGKKTTTALSLFLGGLGQINGGSNPALDFLNNQVDRDIKAQMARSDQAKTIYGAYKDLYGEGVATYNATKASMLDILARQSDQVAAQLATPLAQANNLKLKSALAVEKSKALQDAAVSLNDLPGNRPAARPMGPSNAPSGGGGGGAGQSQDQSKPVKGSVKMEQNEKGGGASASWDDSEPEEKLGGKSTNNSTLVPGHAQRLQHLQKFNIFQKDPNRAAGLQEAYNQQVKVDEALARVDDLYNTMYKETNGLSGRIHRGINPHAIAAGTGAAGTVLGGALGAAGTMGVGTVPGALGGGTVGTGLGEGIGHGLQALTNTDANARYDTDYATLKSMIAAALPGRGDQLVEELARKYAPTDRDTKEGAIKKREALKADLVQLSARSGPLKQVGIVK